MGKWRTKGGFTGVIESVTFEEKTWESQNPSAKNKEYRTVTAKVMVLKEGADEAVEQFLPAGFLYDGQGVSEDGKTLTDENSVDGPIIDGDSDFARLIDTIEENEGEDGALAAAFAESHYRNFEALEGRRFDFRPEVNVERQMASGRKKLGIKKADSNVGKGGKEYTDEQIMEAGKRDGKGERKGQKFNQNRLTVVKVYAGEAKPAAKIAGKSAKEMAAEAAKSPASRRPAPAPEPDEDEEEAAEGPSDKEAAKFLKELLDDEDGSFDRKDITVLVSRKIKDAAARKAMTAKLLDEDFLGSVKGVSYVVKGKNATISLD